MSKYNVFIIKINILLKKKTQLQYRGLFICLRILIYRDGQKLVRWTMKPRRQSPEYRQGTESTTRESGDTHMDLDHKVGIQKCKAEVSSQRGYTGEQKTITDWK